MGRVIRRKVVKVLPSRDVSGPENYLLECGHEELFSPRVYPAEVGIRVVHPKTIRCRICENREAQG